MIKGFLTTTEAAELLNYHPGSVQRLCKTKRLPAARVGSTWAIPKAAVERYRRFREDPLDRRRPRNCTERSDR